MPYRLRKAPNRDLYWVVGEDGTKHSKDPIPKERAEAQRKALYIAMRKKRGGAELHDDEELHGGAKNFRRFMEAVEQLKKEIPNYEKLIDKKNGRPIFETIDDLIDKTYDKIEKLRKQSRSGTFQRKTESYNTIQEQKKDLLDKTLLKIMDIIEKRAESSDEFYERRYQYRPPPQPSEPESSTEQPYPQAYAPEARTNTRADARESERKYERPEPPRRKPPPRKSPPVRPLPTDKPSAPKPPEPRSSEPYRSPESILEEYGFTLPRYMGSPTPEEQRAAKKIYMKEALKSHPDKNGDPEVFKKITGAYNSVFWGKGKYIQKRVRK
jgi:hypothetical protein